MHRCYVNTNNWQQDLITLTKDEEHHLLDVIRATPGNIVKVFDGQGRSALAELVLESDGTFQLHVQPDTLKQQITSAKLVLIVALPKGKRMDLVVEKATELGVSEIWPVISERVISRPDNDRLTERVDRWNRIAKSAAKQCGIDKIPSIPTVESYKDAITKSASMDLLLIGSLDAAPGTMRSTIEKFLHSADAKSKKLSLKKIGLLIGPEGDFTQEEMSTAIDAGAVPVSFGPLTLRVETAALYGLCVLRYALNDA